jgi:hypothetical protein
MISPHPNDKMGASYCTEPKTYTFLDSWSISSQFSPSLDGFEHLQPSCLDHKAKVTGCSVPKHPHCNKILVLDEIMIMAKSFPSCRQDMSLGHPSFERHGILFTIRIISYDWDS